MTTSRIKKNGILNGGVIGFSYILIIYLVSSIIGSGFALNIYSIIMILIGIAAGMIGGVVRSKHEVKEISKIE
ncbi:MAG: TIGR04086 family membrane protein [Clostridia bacterium]|nr:TIGR04086 family membrane protein [Clostridia bacterium]